MFGLTKADGKTFVIVFVAGLAALALHQTVIAPRIAPKSKAPVKA